MKEREKKKKEENVFTKNISECKIVAKKNEKEGKGLHLLHLLFEGFLFLRKERKQMVGGN